MSTKVPFKAQAMARDLAVRLKNRIAGVTIQEDLDSERFPTFRCYVTAGQSAFVRISTDFERSDEDGHVDSLGLAQRVYTPHKTELLKGDETDTTAIVSATEEAAYRAMVIQLTAELSKNGTKFIIREGSGVLADTNWADADTAASTTVAEVRSDDIHGLTKQM